MSEQCNCKCCQATEKQRKKEEYKKYFARLVGHIPQFNRANTAGVFSFDDFFDSFSGGEDIDINILLNSEEADHPINKHRFSVLGDCLDEAKQTITGERQDSYGNPEDSFDLISEYWNTYLMEQNKDVGGLTGLDVTHMMILLKIARCSGQETKRDNYVDIAGYASIAADELS